MINRLRPALCFPLLALHDGQQEEAARVHGVRHVRPDRGQVRGAVRRADQQNCLRGEAGALLERHVEVSTE